MKPFNRILTFIGAMFISVALIQPAMADSRTPPDLMIYNQCDHPIMVNIREVNSKETSTFQIPKGGHAIAGFDQTNLSSDAESTHKITVSAPQQDTTCNAYYDGNFNLKIGKGSFCSVDSHPIPQFLQIPQITACSE